MKPTSYAVEQLNPYHQNARRGNTEAIAESLESNGQYKPIVVNAGTLTGRPDEVLVGNHTLEAARQLGWDKIEAVVIDVDDDRARRIVLADNRTSDLGGYNDQALLDLLQQQDDLLGTAFDSDYVTDLAAHLAAPSLDDLAEQYGDPEEADLYVQWIVRVPERVGKSLRAALDCFEGEEHEQAEQLADFVLGAQL